jgi:hypothetical protein
MSPCQKAKVMASASLALGILTLGLAVRTHLTRSPTTLLLAAICFLPAIVLGVLAKIQARRAGGPLGAKGQIPTGTAVAVIALIPVFVGAAESVRWAAVRARAINSLHAIGLALQAYEREHGRLPPAAIRDAAGRPLLSWRVLLLPYLEQGELYRRFHLDEPWNSPHNRTLLEQMPRIYHAEAGNPSGPPNSTFYQVFDGKGTAFEGEGLTLDQINGADGCANTILVVEAGQAVPWTKPADLPYAAGQPLPAFGDFYKHEHYVNPRGRFLALFADGSVRCFFHATPERVIRPLLTWNGGEAVDWNELEPWCGGMRGDATWGKARP